MVVVCRWEPTDNIHPAQKEKVLSKTFQNVFKAFSHNPKMQYITK
jgi:hypothetical protein